MTDRPSDRPDDDLSRQRRKRDERRLAMELPDDPNVTLGEVVAEVLAAAATMSDGAAEAELDVRTYLARQGHSWATIKAVVDYLDRQDAAQAVSPRPPRRR
jgi:hypothetical protein